VPAAEAGIGARRPEELARHDWSKTILFRVLFLGAGALAMSWLGLPSLDRHVFGFTLAEAQRLKPSALPVSLCIAGTDAPALRAWASEHPKSRRGRLDHQRLRLHAD